MAKGKLSASDNQGAENTLAKRVLNSNLNDEDKVDLIQMLGNHSNIISTPFVWTPDPQPLSPLYHEHPEFIVTCSLGNDARPRAASPV